jgi:hypothetical protein
MINDIELPLIDFPKQSFYLYYDDEGNITDLVNYKKDIGNYVEVTEDFVKEFRSSSKSITSYTIKLGNNIKLEKKLVERNLGSFLIIPETKELTELSILVTNKVIKFSFSNAEIHKKVSLSENYNFYIVSSHNLNFIKSTIKVSYNQLVKGYVHLHKFNKDKELIVTKKYFDSYGMQYE